MIEITEKDKRVTDAWFEEAKNQTIESLPEFLKKLSHAYKHDYFTICSAIAAAALGAAWATDNAQKGGITPSQANIVMSEFMRKWTGVNSPFSCIQYDKMLFPQFEHKFQKTINIETWEWMQNKAKEYLKEDQKGSHPDIIKHWQNIVDGKIPFGYKLEDDGE